MNNDDLKSEGNPISQNLHPLLTTLIPVVNELASAIGSDTEVVLHALNRLPNSIVAISGNVTGRKVGGPMTDLLARLIRKGRIENQNNYHTVLPDGRVLRSSTIFIRDFEGSPVGCICFNTDVSAWQRAMELIQGRINPRQMQQDSAFKSVALGTLASNFTDFPDATDEYRHGSEQSPSFGNDSNQVAEYFVASVDELQKTMVDNAIASIGVPLELMTKNHKMKIVQILDEGGFFLIRDSAEYLAHVIGVTRYTIYNYLNQLRISSKFNEGSTD